VIEAEVEEAGTGGNATKVKTAVTAELTAPELLEATDPIEVTTLRACSTTVAENVVATVPEPVELGACATLTSALITFWAAVEAAALMVVPPEDEETEIEIVLRVPKTDCKLVALKRTDGAFCVRLLTVLDARSMILNVCSVVAFDDVDLLV